MKKNRLSIYSDDMEIIPERGGKDPDKTDISPRDFIWYADWKIMLRDPAVIEKICLGVIRFEGEPILGKVNISIDIEERYRNRGYASRALKMMRDHIFWLGDIYEIEAVVDMENDAAIHAFSNAGFVYRHTDNNDGVKTETYSVTKPKTVWSGLYLFIGIIVGLSLGIMMANILIGLVTGVLAGLIVGGVMDSRSLKKRQDVTGRKE